MAKSASAPTPTSEHEVETAPQSPSAKSLKSMDESGLEKLEKQKDNELANRRELSAAEEDEAGKVYPPTSQAALVMVGLYLSLFLVALDRTIISTAVPAITSDFHSIDHIGWYASSYMITGCAFQLFFGRIYTFYSPKWCFIASVALFELGSLICAVAPSSAVFILGRAIAGLGAAGIFSGTIVVTLHIIPLRKRPVYQSLMGAVILISSVVGPLIGGAFTTHLTWRWCFYINLPIGGATMLVSVFLLPAKQEDLDEEAKRSKTLSIRQKIERLDPIGTACFLPAIVCLLLALQWGGTTYAWNDARIIALWVLFGLLTLAFLADQVWQGENATIPPRIAKYRSVSASTWFAFAISASLMTLVYWLPAWFQGVQGVDAVQSGIRILPTILALVVSSILAGGTVSRIGYYTPLLIACSIITATGAGLMMTFRVDTSRSIWIGYQIIFGFGLGLGQQQAGLAAQTVLPIRDVPIGVSFKFFGQQLGGAIFVSVGQNVFNDRLLSGLRGLGAQNINAKAIQNLGADEITQLVSPDQLHEVLIVYNDAIMRVFMVGAILAALSLIGSLLTEWKSVKGTNVKKA